VADQRAHEPLDAAGVRRAGDDRVDRDAGPGRLLGEAARDREQRRLGRRRSGSRAAVAQLHRQTVAIADQPCRPGFRGFPFIDAAAEHPDPADPVHRTVADHRAWLNETVVRAFRTAGHPEPDEAGRRHVMLRDGAMVAGHLGDAAAAAALSAGVADLLAAA
jgi:hypothetical protein